MIRYLPIFLAVALLIFCLVELAQSQRDAVRVMPRWLWFFTLIMLPIVGPTAWLIFGRPTANSIREANRGPGTPDDDPDFLRGLR